MFPVLFEREQMENLLSYCLAAGAVGLLYGVPILVKAVSKVLSK